MEQQNQPSHETDRIIPPRRSATIEALLKVNKVDHPIAQKYLQQFAEYQEKHKAFLESQPKKEIRELPELRPVDLESLYSLFLEAFSFFNEKPFDEQANKGEGRKLARTLIAYFLKRKAFLRSPLLNTSLNEPSLEKGLMIIGGVGTGKTSIVRTFHEMFRLAQNHPLGVKDIDGTMQFLGRYKLGFGFYSTNDVVDHYEACTDDLTKKAFRDKYDFGTKYFDDLMSEDVASNYGKKEIFKKILEKRYFNRVNTMVSLNYHGSSVEETFDAIGDRYDTRVYDRNFEMFNILELSGKSLRR